MGDFHSQANRSRAQSAGAVPACYEFVCVKGSIYSDQRCPICGGKFVHDENRDGLFCPAHPEIRATEKFRVRFGKNGTQKRFKEYHPARQFLEGLRFETNKGSYDKRDYQDKNPLGFEAQAHKWLGFKERDVKPNTYRDIRRTIHAAIDAWGPRNVKTIGYADIEDFLYALGVGDKTRSNARSHLNGFFTWLERREGIPVPDMPEINFELGWRNIIDLETQQAILDEVYRQTWDFNPRVWIGIKWLATYVSIRPNELRMLRERDININGLIVVISPKEKKPKLVPMLEEDIELFESLPKGLPDLFFFRHLKGNAAAKPGSQFSKDYLYRCWKRACDALKISGVDLYGGTRHSTTSALSEHFSLEQLRQHGTMHATNKAFERYMQTDAPPSKAVYEKAQELAQAKRKNKAKVIPLKKPEVGQK